MYEPIDSGNARFVFPISAPLPILKFEEFVEFTDATGQNLYCPLLLQFSFPRPSCGYNSSIMSWTVVDEKFMWNERSKETLDLCKRDEECWKFVQNHKFILNHFCGYNLHSLNVEFHKGDNSLLVDSSDRIKLDKMITDLETILSKKII